MTDPHLSLKVLVTWEWLHLRLCHRVTAGSLPVLLSGWPRLGLAIRVRLPRLSFLRCTDTMPGERGNKTRQR